MAGRAEGVERELPRQSLVVAAGCAFYALFAIFPALSALISLYGLTADPATVEQQFGMLASVLPPQAYHIVIEQIRPSCRELEPSRSAGASAQHRACAVERHVAHPGDLRRAQHRL